MKTLRDLVQPFALETTVFVCGMVVMIYEIIGSRVVSPYIGASTYVWTSLIGVILGALSVGYWLGGRIADRKPDLRVLASVIFAAGGLIGLSVLLKDVLLPLIAASPVLIEIKALIAAVLLFAPASVCLGIITPFAVRLKLANVDKTGSTVGRLYALSTVGSIIGTFAAGFFLIPFVGSIRTLYGIAALLIALAFLLAPVAVSRTNIAAALLLILGITGSEIDRYAMTRLIGMYDVDTEYARVRVFRTTDVRSNRPITVLTTDPYSAQSAIFPDSDEMVFEYGRYYHLVAHFKPDFQNVLMIGGAGYSFPKEFLLSYPKAKMDVVEIDPGMTDIARKYFRLKEDPRLRIVHEDGRMFLNKAADSQYDAVLMDAFGSLFSVPYHLTTVEAVKNVSRVLADDGVVIFNLGSALTGPASRFLAAELATYRAVFPSVYVFKVRPERPDTDLQNLIIVALQAPAPSRQESADKFADLLSREVKDHQFADVPLLTDDLAPVEYYNSIAQNYSQLTGKD
jgi:spermidine synthase